MRSVHNFDHLTLKIKMSKLLFQLAASFRLYLARTSYKQASRCLLLGVLAACISGCSVIAVADATVTVVATGVKVTAKAVGAVADAVIPDDDEDEDD